MEWQKNKVEGKGGEVHGGEEVRGEAKEEVLYRRNI